MPPKPLSSATFFDRSTATEEYWKWIADNPDGFVLNTFQEPSARYLKLHRADCPTVTTHKRYGKGGAVKREYSKACALQREAVLAWVTEQGFSLASVRECATCCPQPEDFDSITGEQLDQEGHRRLRTHLVTERSARNRRLALKARAKPYQCEACDETLADYGSAFGELIHVHHVRPVGQQVKNPKSEDFLLLCPNCHAIAHWGRATDPLPLKELRNYAAAAKKKRAAVRS